VDLLGGTTTWTIVRLGDFNGDGRSDIIWRHSDGTTAIWLMDGIGISSFGDLLGKNTGWSAVP